MICSRNYAMASNHELAYMKIVAHKLRDLKEKLNFIKDKSVAQ
jgi:hypothetical protein